MARVYGDYINVNNEFIPVFNQWQDKKNPSYWKTFYPHSTFKSILDSLVGSLEATTTETSKPLWVYGAYGTGKTFAAFTLKHIIEESNESVREYFEKYTISESLRKRLDGVKAQGKILIVHRPSSSDISGDKSLFSAIQEAIKRELRLNGFSYLGGKTLYDNVLDRIQDPDDAFNFRGIFKKYKDEYFNDLDNVDRVIDNLIKWGSDEKCEPLTTSLLLRIIEVADKSGFNFVDTVNDVIMWIDDIIKQNNLRAILFIWDEFTDYFIQNSNTTGGLLELAHASGKMPFYFLLITHKAHEQFIYDTDVRKKLEARFKMNKIEMAETTAFMLMRNAIELNQELKDEWKNIKDNLWLNIEKIVKNSINHFSEDINNDDLKGLMPLHPFSSLFLQDISSKIGSNNRTMFQFLCGDPYLSDEVKYNFRWFIANHSVTSWPYLTADHLWDYFFDLDNVDLDEKATKAIIHFSNYKSQCDSENELRVFKVAMLLSAIQREKGRGISNLLRPTLTNISNAFAGTEIYDHTVTIMDKLVEKSAFGILPEGNDKLYVTQSHSIDVETEKDLEKQLRNSFSFEAVIVDQNLNVAESFELSGFANARFDMLFATHNNLTSKLESTQNLESNKVPIIILFAKSEEDAAKNFLAIQKAVNQNYRDLVVVDLSSLPLTNQEYNNFIKCKARSRYFIKVDSSQARVYEEQAKNLIANWKNKINNAQIKIYYKNNDPKTIIGTHHFSVILTEINSKIFPCGIENLINHDKVFSTTGYSEAVAAMGMNKATIPANYSYLKSFKEILKGDNLWSNNSYSTDLPSHPLAQMKIAIDKLMNDSFNRKSNVAIIDIWTLLKNKPFGLMSCTGSAFVLGFLLKEYANSGYYKTDLNSNSIPLTHDNLSDMIVGIIKGLRNADNQFIVKMTEDHELFCKYSGVIFNLPAEKQNSIQDVLKSIKTALTYIGYPLWALKYYLIKNDNIGFADIASSAIDLYCDFISINKSPDRDETAIAEEIIHLFKQNTELKDYMKNHFTVDILKEGMVNYIARYKPELIDLAGKLSIGKDYLIEIKEAVSDDASWLWEKRDIEKSIDDVCLNYQIINSINKIIQQRVSKLNQAIEAVNSRISSLKIPYDYLQDAYSEIDGLFVILLKLYKTSTLMDTDKAAFLEQLNDKAEQFISFYNEQPHVFKNIASNLLGTEISDEEASYLYKEAESNAILKPLHDFESDIKKIWTTYSKNKKYEELIEVWKNITQSDSPLDWSNKNRFPILVLFNSDILSAKNAFDLVNAGKVLVSDLEIDKAISFIKDNIKSDILCNEDYLNQIFKDYFSGEYGILIQNINEIKDMISEEVGPKAYDWYMYKTVIDKIVLNYAASVYKESFYYKVEEKIDKLQIDQTKQYLKTLIKNEPLVGIKIMKSYEE